MTYRQRCLHLARAQKKRMFSPTMQAGQCFGISVIRDLETGEIIYSRSTVDGHITRENGQPVECQCEECQAARAELRRELDGGTE